MLTRLATTFSLMLQAFVFGLLTTTFVFDSDYPFYVRGAVGFGVLLEVFHLCACLNRGWLLAMVEEVSSADRASKAEQERFYLLFVTFTPLCLLAVLGALACTWSYNLWVNHHLSRSTPEWVIAFATLSTYGVAFFFIRHTPRSISSALITLLKTKEFTP
jgi:hypothetical protein